MKKFEQHNDDLPSELEAMIIFNKYQAHNREIAELVKKHRGLAEALGQFAVLRGYKQWEVAEVITESMNIMKEILRNANIQAATASQKSTES